MIKKSFRRFRKVLPGQEWEGYEQERSESPGAGVGSVSTTDGKVRQSRADGGTDDGTRRRSRETDGIERKF